VDANRFQTSLSFPPSNAEFQILNPHCFLAQSGFHSQPRLALTLAKPLKKTIESFSVRCGDCEVFRFLLQNKLQADAILAPADGPGVNADGAFHDFIAAGGILQSHEDKSAWIPAFLSDYVQPG
jgi:hypothetical protein